ncbi:MAG TPA: hypothetical protein ENI80_00760 [Acidiferrobacteraceae bacterium]|nr:hypothetical protein [Acidiferrobacteraceae bacterium]
MTQEHTIIPLEIKRVSNRRELKTFIGVPFTLYQDSPYWVPPLISDDLATFNPKKNPAYETAQTRLFVAYRDGVPVGRIAAILNYAANKKYQTKNLRFGWFDTINELEVARSLFAAVEAWARELGMETLTGPHGFCDFDPQGMLTQGYDQLPTIATYYNYPYYVELTVRCGFEKEVDYVEFLTPAPTKTGIPPKLERIAKRVRERSKLKVVNFKNKRQLLKRAPELFQLVDETFEEIYGSVPLSEKQMRYYIKKYISFVNYRTVKIAVNERDEMVGFMLAMPSLSRGFQKAKGRLLPLGWWHILKSLRSYDVLDFYLAGIRSQYRGTGVDLLMQLQMIEVALDLGFNAAESNPELESNKKVQAQWKYFNPVLHKRRRIFRKRVA